MTANEITPLSSAVWFDRIQQLRAWPMHEKAELERALRHSFHMAQLAPLVVRSAVSTPSETEFEALLERGALFEAVNALRGGSASKSGVDARASIGETVPKGSLISLFPSGENAAVASLLRDWLNRLTDSFEGRSAAPIAECAINGSVRSTPSNGSVTITDQR